MSHTFRAPTITDGPALHALISRCPPLDVNSAYLYHLIGWHYSDTSILALDAKDDLRGAITGYIPPQDGNTLFVWQVAVDEQARGHGLAGRMLTTLLSTLPQVTTIHTTIGPGNDASHRLFARLASTIKAAHHCSPLIAANACGDGHEAEDLVTIGPFQHTALSALPSS